MSQARQQAAPPGPPEFNESLSNQIVQMVLRLARTSPTRPEPDEARTQLIRHALGNALFPVSDPVPLLLLKRAEERHE